MRDMTYIAHSVLQCVVQSLQVCDMTLIWAFIWDTRLIRKCGMTHSYVRHDSFICATWLIHMCDMTHSYVWHDSLTCATWPIHTCDMTNSCVRHDSFHLRHDPFYVCDMTHPYVRHDSFIRATWLTSCATWLIHMCDMTHSYVRHDSHHVRHDSFHVCDMTHNSDGNGLVGQIAGASPICAMTHSMCDMTHSVCVTWLIIQTEMDSWLKSLEQVTALFEASKVNEGKTALSLEESQRELRSLFIYMGLISRSLLTLPLVYCAMLRLVKFTRKNTALSFEESQRKLRSLFDIINGVSDIFLGLFSIDTALFLIDTGLFSIDTALFLMLVMGWKVSILGLVSIDTPHVLTSHFIFHHQNMLVLTFYVSFQ